MRSHWVHSLPARHRRSYLDPQTTELKSTKNIKVWLWAPPSWIMVTSTKSGDLQTLRSFATFCAFQFSTRSGPGSTSWRCHRAAGSLEAPSPECPTTAPCCTPGPSPSSASPPKQARPCHAERSQGSLARSEYPRVKQHSRQGCKTWKITCPTCPKGLRFERAQRQASGPSGSGETRTT